jgi:hypothetical protein
MHAYAIQPGGMTAAMDTAIRRPLYRCAEVLNEHARRPQGGVCAPARIPLAIARTSANIAATVCSRPRPAHSRDNAIPAANELFSAMVDQLSAGGRAIPHPAVSKEGGSGPEFVEQALVERHQPALRDLAAGDEEHPDGLPGPQLAVALQLGSASCTACWSSAKMAPGSTRKVTLAWARRAAK